MKIAIASCTGRPPGLDDDELLRDELNARGVGAEILPWDAEADWESYELVVLRSTWDYTRRLDDFLAWTDSLDGQLRNRREVVRWNSDKRYLADLASAGLAVVPTRFLGPGEELPEFDGEFVVKPQISAGARRTGRFWPAQRDAAEELIARIHGDGHLAMVQPYLDDVDREGELAAVYCDGVFSHGLRKRAVLRAGEVAPTRDDALGAAEAMYSPDLVERAEIPPDALGVADAVVAHVSERFGVPPLYARVDLARDHGRPTVMELELIEPFLYLGLVPEAAGRLADAIARACANGA